MNRSLLIVSALFGVASIALGAFGTHGLSEWAAALPDGADRMRWWSTAVTYHQLHAVFLFALAVWAQRHTSGAVTRAFKVTTVGLCVFSGTLYVMTLTGIKVLGAVTPIGGVLLMAGWALTAWAAYAVNEP